MCQLWCDSHASLNFPCLGESFFSVITIMPENNWFVKSYFFQLGCLLFPVYMREEKNYTSD